MSEKYPSTFIQKYPTKTAFLIDCANGLSSFTFVPRFIDNFPPNSDIFLFYHNNEPGMNRRFKRFESDNHGVFFFPTTEHGVHFNLSFILGQIQDKYQDFILITDYHAAYGDLCEQLITNNSQLKNHIQVRLFGRMNEFEQFLKEMTRLQNDDEKKNNENQRIVLNYSRKHLFHACPFETRQESSNLYRFGELLQHLDNEHTNMHYDYCKECQQIIESGNLKEFDVLEEHLQDKHWNANGFQLSIRHLQ
jgi:hypothetical protein